jgi:hypothetical protein
VSDDAYLRALALAIDAEYQRASLHIHNRQALGVAREAILRDLVVRQTPHPLEVTTGFVGDSDGKRLFLSRQCDVLVYDPSVAKPVHEIDAFVVVPRRAAKFIIEVKTRLQSQDFVEIVKVWRSVHWLPVKTFGFAFGGVPFGRFVKFLSVCIEKGVGLPECVAVHRRNYLFFRTHSDPGSMKLRHGIAVCFSSKQAGAATALFLRLYRGLLEQPSMDKFLLQDINRADYPGCKKVWLDSDGKRHDGAIPHEVLGR